MGNLTTYTKNKLLDHILGTSSYTHPETVYVALFTTATGDAGTGTEMTYTGYARQAVACDAASGGAASNNAAITFPTVPAGENGGTASHFAIYDAPTNGNMLMHNSLTTATSCGANNTPQFATGELDFSAD